ncbi:MAG: leucyl/phenylalanyl-tRNA--protein transferase [Bdellovibrionota bacterium]
MTISAFPPVDDADEDGLLCVGGDLEVDSLLLAYRSGIFPWPVSTDCPLVWFAPPTRAVLFLDQVHISRSLMRARERSGFTFSIDSQCENVIRNCARSKNRGKQRGTWIIPQMIKAYSALHRAGWCHSVECLDGDRLVGGLYGVSIGDMFAGESMFYLEPNASKLALWHLITHLQERNVPWLDCQQLTPLLASFGAVEIPRKQFMGLLGEAVTTGRNLFSPTIQKNL